MVCKSEYKNIDEKYILMANDILSKNEFFCDGYRVMFLIQRHKDGGHTNNSKLRTYITRNREEWISSLAKLLQEKDQYPNVKLRIYQTINSRNIKKAIRIFKQMQLDNDYYDEESRNNFYIDIKNRMVSALMKCSDKDRKFLIDVDMQDANEVDKVKNELEKLTSIIHWYQTPNGTHYIVKAFNHTLFPKMENVEIKTDAMMLLDF